MDMAEAFLNRYVAVYLLIVVAVQFYLGYRAYAKRRKILKQRQRQGLPADVIIDHAERLADLRRESLTQSVALLATVFFVPVVIKWLPTLGAEERQGLAIMFIAIFVWLLLTGTDVARAFLGGLAFKTVASISRPFQVGDRVTLKGISGKVLELGTFFVKLQTPDDDLVSIPTSGLWSEALSSANAGERSSMVVIHFYLAPAASKEQRRAAENAIIEIIQASPYFEVSRPMQVYYAQQVNAIQLTAKAYVASTYKEPFFKSDVTRAFLDFASDNAIPLPSPVWVAHG